MSLLLRIVFALNGVLYLALAAWLTPIVLRSHVAAQSPTLASILWLYLLVVGAITLCAALLAPRPPEPPSTSIPD